MTPEFVNIPKLEDEIEDAWQNWLCQTNPTFGELAEAKQAFVAGFRLARTVVSPRWMNP